MAHVNAPLSVHRFRNNVSAHSLHDEDGGKKFSFPRTMIKNHQDCKTAATSTTCHFAHQRRLEHEFSQPAGAFVPDPVFSACVTLSQTNAACVQPWQERHSVVLFSNLLQPRLPDFYKARVPAATVRVVGIFCLYARSLRNAQASYMECLRILPKIIVPTSSRIFCTSTHSFKMHIHAD